MIIGISGKMGTGKTTLMEYILQRWYSRFDTLLVPKAFGDPVKMETAEYFGFPVEWCFTEGGKAQCVPVPVSKPVTLHGGFQRMSITVREAMQWYATDYKRKEDPDYWVKAFEKSVALDLAQERSVIIHDVRFPNELEWIESKGGKTIRLEPYCGWVCSENGKHFSETALDAVPHERWNYEVQPEYGTLDKIARIVVERII